MRKIREAYGRFMQGRYGCSGVDEFGRFLSVAAFVFVLLSLIFRKVFVFYWIGLALLVYCYYRICSRNFDKRYRENESYLNLRYNRAVFIQQFRRRREELKNHRIFTCPQCRQKVRVPRGKGRIAIHCPKCGKEFVKKS